MSEQGRFEALLDVYCQAVFAEGESHPEYKAHGGEFQHLYDASEEARAAVVAHVTDLVADRDSWADQADQRVKDWHEEHLRAKRLAAENARLRGALTEYDAAFTDFGDTKANRLRMRKAIIQARAALEQPK